MKEENLLLKISLYCFILTSVIGLIGSFKIALYADWVEWIDFRRIMPLHTFLALVAQLSGLLGFSFYILKNDTPQKNKILTHSLILFIIFGVISIIAGKYSGREYITWPPYLTPLLLFSIIISAYRLLCHRKKLSQTNPEGFWLLFSGHLFIIGGLIESHLWLLPVVKENFTKDITIQWHGIDTFIAGINIGLYGGTIFLLNQQPKPLRKSSLFVVAIFSLLFTFGHHHYISAQPFSLKILALIASLLGIFSLLKNFKEYRKLIQLKSQNNNALSPLIRSITLWTLVSVATGILFAIPQINFFVHGTYWIVAHAMGSMIGANMLIIVLGIYSFKKESIMVGNKIKIGVLLINSGLVLLWIFLGIAGTIKAIGRIHSDFITYSQQMEPALWGFPIIGLILITGIYFLFYDLLKEL